MTKPHGIQNAFTRNRSEELELDVWNEFVVPPFYDKLDIDTTKKPKLIEGGRGCGKTMLLRYLSYHSKFSKNRTHIPESEAKCIGLYWRADTQFLKTLSGRGIDQDLWANIFNSFLNTKISTEIVESIIKIADSNYNLLNSGDLLETNFDEFGDFHPLISGNIYQLKKALQSIKRKFESAISNPNLLNTVHLLPPNFSYELAEKIKSTITALSDSNFFIYIDEYENLREYQQEVINTKIKHSQPPLIFNIAMKEHGMKSKKTVGDESISQIHDYRLYNIDRFLTENGVFELFAAEILVYRLSLATTLFEDRKETVNETLKDPSKIDERLTNDHRNYFLGAAKRLLPGKSHKQLADDALRNNATKKQCFSDIESAIKGTKFIGTDFYSETHPQATIVNTSLLNRKNLSHEILKTEFERHLQNEKSSYDNWIHNNFIGSYLKLFKAYNKTCPYYAGFDTFLRLSKGNIRHFLELLRSSVKISTNLNTEDPVIDIEHQAQAAKLASEELLMEIDSFGSMGLQLSKFSVAIGHLFSLAHRRASQSEPEINHFSINDDNSSIKKDDKDFFNEAIKWGVLIEEKSTKNKDPNSLTLKDYILHPIYAPHFLISYAKKRKINLSIEQIRVLINGTDEEIRSLENHFKRLWDLEEVKVGNQNNPENLELDL